MIATATAGRIALAICLVVGTVGTTGVGAEPTTQQTSIDVIDVDAPDTVGPDENFEVAVSLENPTDEVQEGRLRITIGDELFVRDVELAPGETRTITQSVWSGKLSVTDHRLRAEIGSSARSTTVTVDDSDEYERLPPTIRSVEAPAGKASTVTVEVPMEAERIGIVANYSAALGARVVSVDGGEVVIEVTPDERTILAVENADTPTLRFQVRPSEELVGERELLTVTSIDGQDRKHLALISVSVVEPEGELDLVDRYRNEDGTVTIRGLTRAVEDWSNGEIDDVTLAMVVDAWAESS